MHAAQAPLRTIINPRALGDKKQSKTAARLKDDLIFINYPPHPFRPLWSVPGLCGFGGFYTDVINAAALGPLRTRCHFAAAGGGGDGRRHGRADINLLHLLPLASRPLAAVGECLVAFHSMAPFQHTQSATPATTPLQHTNPHPTFRTAHVPASFRNSQNVRLAFKT